MKKFCLFLFSILAFAVSADGSSLIYTKRQIVLGDKRIKLYAAEFTLQDYSLQIVKAMEGKLGSESLLDMVERYRPVVATNGSFFKAYNGPLAGIPSWLLQSRSDIYATEGRYPVFYVSGNEYGIIQTSVSPYVQIADETFPVLTLNAPDLSIKPPKFSYPVHIINQSYWHKTMTLPDSFEALFSRRGYLLQLAEAGNNMMPEGGFALIAGNSKGQEIITEWIKGDKVSYGVKYSAPQLQDADYIISGSDIIVQDGKVAKHIERYKGNNAFINGRHARTAICIRSDNSIGLYVVEDPAKELHEEMSIKEVLVQLQDLGYSMPQIRKMPSAELFAKVREASDSEYTGVTLLEFAAILKEHNCNYALNLDGGSSSAMAYEGELSNIFAKVDNPDLAGQRGVGDAIMVFPKGDEK